MALTRRRLLAGLSAGAATLWLGACGGPAATAPVGTATATPTATAGTGGPSPAPTGASSRASPGGAASPVAAGPLTKVRVGYVPVLIYAPLYLAIEKGYFRDQGIEAIPTPLAGGADIISQTVAGNFEVGLGGLGAAALNAARRNFDFRIVASHHAESPPMTTPLVVSKKKFDAGTSRTIADLRGKKVSINARGTATEYWLQAALAKGGLATKDIDLTALPFDQVTAALDSGALDGAMLGEPLVTLAEDRGFVQRIADDFLTNAQGTVIFYNLKWATDQRSPADRWLAAWLMGARDLGGGGYGKDENAAIIESYTKVPRDVVKRAKPPIHDPNGRLNLADMEAQQQYFIGAGSVSYTAPIDLNTIIDTSYAERAVSMIGRS